jgi:hypothetical protein
MGKKFSMQNLLKSDILKACLPQILNHNAIIKQQKVL